MRFLDFFLALLVCLYKLRSEIYSMECALISATIEMVNCHYVIVVYRFCIHKPLT